MSGLVLTSIKCVSVTFFFSFFFLIAHLIRTPGPLSIQQKFRFEISEISLVQWNGTFRLYRPDPSHRTVGFCSRKQDTKERYWGQQLGHFGPTDLQRWSTICGRIEPKGFVLFDFQPKFPEFWAEWKAPSDYSMSPWCSY